MKQRMVRYVLMTFSRQTHPQKHVTILAKHSQLCEFVSIYAKQLEGHRECPEKAKFCHMFSTGEATFHYGYRHSQQQSLLPWNKNMELEKPDLGPIQIWNIVGRFNVTSQCVQKFQDLWHSEPWHVPYPLKWQRHAKKSKQPNSCNFCQCAWMLETPVPWGTTRCMHFLPPSIIGTFVP